ncbi:MAG: dTDP-4-dehydrorhamnose 3,5-epimerase [Alphaproteobacteria bacterium]|nr:dTDP-4-dehydrorhamnose 3,5-epimerase [Alphaproteobacteria bacterium]
MEISELGIPGVFTLAPRRFEDDRGYFVETYTKNKFDALLEGLEFVQDNESYSRDRHTVRGLHYQSPPHAQDKLVRVVRGRIFDVVVDVRKASPTYGQWVGKELSDANGLQLLAPKGFLHGFMTLEPDTIVAYKVTAFYHGPSDGGVYWASPELGVDWPVGEGEATLSDKDARAGRFAEFTSPF